MATTSWTIRDDQRYLVTVGWAEELGTFFARVHDRNGDPSPLFEAGTRPGEIRSIAQLAEALQGYATLGSDVVSDLRHAASPLA